MSESTVRSREEDDELQWSTKKVKENNRDRVSLEQHSPRLGGEGFSYKEKLIEDIPGAFEQAFNFENVMETEAESDIEDEEVLLLGEVVVKLFGDKKAKIRAAWNNGLIVKVFGKTVGYHYLLSKLTGMWKPTSKMDCIALGQDFFLIRFTLNEDHSKVLRTGPWFVGGHYLSIRRWEPNFRPLEANLSAVAVWIRLPELPIEYYKVSVLKNIGKAIGPVLRIDTHTTSESRGKFARLCVQVNLDKPLVNLIRIGGIWQKVQYEGLGSLCFSCGRVGHQAVGCPYKV